MNQIIIIGAPRSGTNMLRNIVTMLPGFGTWPCDEINYIWRHHNATYPSDEFSIELATEQAVNYIQNQFDKLKEKDNLKYVVDKTTANSLRIKFINRIFPDAKYIYIVRNGIDVVASFMKKKNEPKNIHDILKKIRYVPAGDFPYYTYRFLNSRIRGLVFGKDKNSYWGPNLAAMDEIVTNYNLAEVCALQWKKCVDMADDAFNIIPEDRKLYLKYETFVEDPIKFTREICAFTTTEFPQNLESRFTDYVSNKSVGKGIRENKNLDITIRPLIQDTLKRHGYE